MTLRHFIKPFAVFAAMTFSGSGAAAQGLEIAPLMIDIAPGEEAGLVMASLDLPQTAPSISGLLSSGGATRAAAVRNTALPQPSIILGVIPPGQEVAFGIETLLPNTVAGVVFGIDDLEAREALRESDPELFLQLVSEGHIDPEAAQLNRVIQTELARMNCYRSGIDGQWGPGSRRSVGNYFDELSDVSWDDQAPTAELFRAIVINGDVDCPVPVVAAPKPRASSSSSSSTRSTTPRAATPKPKAAPAPKASSKPKLNTGGGGIGVFR